MRRFSVATALAVALLGPSLAEAAAPILVRYAVVVGARNGSELPKTGEVLSDAELADYLSEWNPNEDNSEIRKLFALRGLSEVVRQVASLPAEGGDLSGACRIDDVPWRVEMKVRPSGDEVRYQMEIYRREELISAPGIIALLGDRAIVSAGASEGGGPGFFFVVVQTDRAPGAEVADGAEVKRGEVRRPAVRRKVDPEYPDSEKKNGTQGQVVVVVKVGADGSVKDARIAQSLGRAFDDAALAAVRQWEFDPGLVDGKPAEVEYRLTINFVPGPKEKS